MPKKILYIEDNHHNRQLVKRILEAETFHVAESENGLDGITKAETFLPDLIIVDINLPDIDGYEVTKRLRNHPQLSTIPILAMTANVMQGDREKAIEAGCDGYIRKPIDVDLLPQQVAEYL